LEWVAFGADKRPLAALSAPLGGSAYPRDTICMALAAADAAEKGADGCGVAGANSSPTGPRPAVAGPQLGLRLVGHVEDGRHTWYTIDCTLQAAGASEHLRWRVCRRLFHLREELYDRVKTALGSSYEGFFEGAPFALRGGLPGTTARLTNWCDALASCISGGGAPSGVLVIVLQFFKAPTAEAYAHEPSPPTQLLPATASSPSPVSEIELTHEGCDPPQEAAVFRASKQEPTYSLPTTSPHAGTSWASSASPSVGGSNFDEDVDTTCGPCSPWSGGALTSNVTPSSAAGTSSVIASPRSQPTSQDMQCDDSALLPCTPRSSGRLSSRSPRNGPFAGLAAGGDGMLPALQSEQACATTCQQCVPLDGSALTGDDSPKSGTSTILTCPVADRPLIPQGAQDDSRSGTCRPLLDAAAGASHAGTGDASLCPGGNGGTLHGRTDEENWEGCADPVDGDLDMSRDESLDEGIMPRAPLGSAQLPMAGSLSTPRIRGRWGRARGIADKHSPRPSSGVSSRNSSVGRSSRWRSHSRSHSTSVDASSRFSCEDRGCLEDEGLPSADPSIGILGKAPPVARPMVPAIAGFVSTAEHRSPSPAAVMHDSRAAASAANVAVSASAQARTRPFVPALQLPGVWTPRGRLEARSVGAKALGPSLSARLQSQCSRPQHPDTVEPSLSARLRSQCSQPQHLDRVGPSLSARLRSHCSQPQHLDMDFACGSAAVAVELPPRDHLPLRLWTPRGHSDGASEMIAPTQSARTPRGRERCTELEGLREHLSTQGADQQEHAGLVPAGVQRVWRARPVA